MRFLFLHIICCCFWGGCFTQKEIPVEDLVIKPKTRSILLNDSLKTLVTGSIYDSKSYAPAIFASVSIYKNDVLIGGVETDFDGQYKIESLQPGNYDLKMQYIGMIDIFVNDITLQNGEWIQIDPIGMSVDSNHVIEVIECFKHNDPPLYDADEFTQGQIFSKERIRQFPSRQ